MSEFDLSWERLPALLVLDAMRPAQVPEAATIALESGMDSPLIRRLADPYQDTSLSQPKVLLANELSRLGVALPTVAGAAEVIARSIAGDIVQEKVDPLAGAHLLAGLSKKVFGKSDVLDPFIYADSEFEDRPGEKELFEKMVLSAVADLIEERLR